MYSVVVSGSYLREAVETRQISKRGERIVKPPSSRVIIIL